MSQGFRGSLLTLSNPKCFQNAPLNSRTNSFKKFAHFAWEEINERSIKNVKKPASNAAIISAKCSKDVTLSLSFQNRFSFTGECRHREQQIHSCQNVGSQFLIANQKFNITYRKCEGMSWTFDGGNKERSSLACIGFFFFLFFSFILLIHEGSHPGRSTRNSKPVMTSSAGLVLRVFQTTGSVHTQPVYTAQLLTLHQHRAINC